MERNIQISSILGQENAPAGPLRKKDGGTVPRSPVSGLGYPWLPLRAVHPRKTTQNSGLTLEMTVTSEMTPNHH